jgi:DDE domain
VTTFRHNNVIEADHGKLKRRIKPTLGFKSMKTAYATIKGFELMHHLRQIAIAYPVLAVPANTNQNDLNRKTATLEHDPS